MPIPSKTHALLFLSKGNTIIGEDYFCALVQQVRTEHRELHQRVKQIRDRLAALTIPRVSAIASAELRQALVALHEYVGHHFSQEENGGWLEEAVVRLPRLAHELTVLEGQHDPLLRRLNQLIDETPTGESSLSAWKHTADNFDVFVHDLFAHEAHEEKIMQTGLNQEIIS